MYGCLYRGCYVPFCMPDVILGPSVALLVSAVASILVQHGADDDTPPPPGARQPSLADTAYLYPNQATAVQALVRLVGPGLEPFTTDKQVAFIRRAAPHSLSMGRPSLPALGGSSRAPWSWRLVTENNGAQLSCLTCRIGNLDPVWRPCNWILDPAMSVCLGGCT
jgi:hypothetical protein